MGVKRTEAYNQELIVIYGPYLDPASNKQRVKCTNTVEESQVLLDNINKLLFKALWMLSLNPHLLQI